jgi:tetratricopeptide (TPR) repeat protein
VRPSVRIALLLGCFALLIRLVYLYEIGGSLFYEVPLVDAKTYVDEALRLPGTSWLGPPEPFWQPPLYPYVLALLFSLFGEGELLAPRLLQALLGAGLCSLVYLVGRRVFPGSVALGAGITAALNGPLIYFGAQLLPTLLGTTLNLLVIYLLMRAPGPRRPAYLLLGALLGLSCLAVANVLLLMPVLLVWLWRTHDAEWRTSQVALIVAGCGLVVLPVTARNVLVGGDAVLISSNAGINFYIGNNAEAEQTINIRPGRQWAELVELPESVAGIEQPSAKSRFFFARASEFALNEPAGFASLLVRKLYRFWHGDELKRNRDPYWARRDSELLSVLLWRGYGLAFPFGLIAPLSLLGLFAFLREPRGRSPEGRLLVLFVLVYMLSVVLFFVTSRYRLPAVPLLLLFAVYGAHTVLHGGKRRLRLVALVGLLVACNWGLAPMPTEADAQQLYWEGYAYAKTGMPANAVQTFRQVLRQEPAHGGALLGLAEMHERRREYDAARELYERFLQEHPESEPVRYQLAGALLRSQRSSDAIREYEALLVGRPDWPRLHGELALAYVMEGLPRKALAAYRQVLEIRPDSTLVRYQMARLHGAVGDTAAAIAQFRRLVLESPDEAEYPIRLAALLIGPQSTPNRSQAMTNSVVEEAEALLTSAIGLDPAAADPHWSLGLMLARVQRYEAALPHFLRLLELEPGDPLVHHCLGNLYERLDRSEEAQQQFDLEASIRRAGRNRTLAESQIRDQVKQFLGR